MPLTTKLCIFCAIFISTIVQATSVLPPNYRQSNHQPSPFYLGGYIGQAYFDINHRDKMPANSFVANDQDKAFKLISGLQFNPFIALEAGFVDLGDISIKGSSPSFYNSDFWQYQAGSAVNGLFANVAVSYPLSKEFSLYGKLGSLSSQANRYYSHNNNDEEHDSWIEEYFDDDREFSVFYGLGAAMTWSNFVLRAEWEQFDNAQGDINVLSLGILYHFK